MNTLNNNNKLPAPTDTRFYFWLFVVLHTIIWTLIPSLMRPTVTHDTLESITWGLQWQLGYYKHPFLTAWLSAAATQLFDSVGWPVYLLAQLAVATTFFATWKLAQQFLDAVPALIASLALEGVLFYNINSFNLTPDTLQSPLWALLALFFYHSLKTQRISYWLATGFVAALCICTKYQAILLFLSMLLLCLTNPTAKKSFQKSGIYLAFMLFIVLITPHFLWLYQHNFVSIQYAFKTPVPYAQTKDWASHLIYPLRYFINNVLSVLGLLVLLWPFYYKSKSSSSKEQQTLTIFQWHFLLFICFGPVLFSLLLCSLSGNYFSPRWSTPYFFALGILMMAYLNPLLNAKSIKRFVLSLIALSFLLVVGKIINLKLLFLPNSDAFLPNKHIATHLTKIWHERYKKPVPFIAGSNYLVASITPYMQDKPIPYLGWEAKDSPWVDEKQLKKQGGLFIWDMGNNYYWDLNSVAHNHLSKSVRLRFPKLIILPEATFYRYSNMKPVLIGIAILPPGS